MKQPQHRIAPGHRHCRTLQQIAASPNGSIEASDDSSSRTDEHNSIRIVTLAARALRRKVRARRVGIRVGLLREGAPASAAASCVTMRDPFGAAGVADAIRSEMRACAADAARFVLTQYHQRRICGYRAADAHRSMDGRRDAAHTRSLRTRMQLDPPAHARRELSRLILALHTGQNFFETIFLSDGPKAQKGGGVMGELMIVQIRELLLGVARRLEDRQSGTRCKRDVGTHRRCAPLAKMNCDTPVLPRAEGD